ncbi:MAG TPA: imidazolonepropionase [Acidisarcina sp.]|nr:imidazolonepropionase [Acidisarcina sp.]
MKADLLVKGISQLVTPEGPGPKHGRAMGELKTTEGAAIAIAAGRVLWTGRTCDWAGEAARTVDAGNRAVVPGLIDPHTHAVWAGDRLADFDARTSGASYESILAAGGGIRSTIRATAKASREELVALAKPRIDVLLRSGATCIEVKSGYGFTAASEIAMLEAIGELARITPARIVPTLLIHIPPAEAANRARYVAEVREELIPEAAKRRLATAVDVFVEREAWHVEEAELMLRAAEERGLRTKLHSEQFHCIGGLELGIRKGALSVDHLEACGPEQLAALARSRTIATILPGVSLHLGLPAAPGHKLIDAGAAVAVGTDLNPGSSPLFSMAAALALAVRLNGLTAREALVAGTVNAASALGLMDAGRIEAGAQADFLILQASDWRELVYAMGTNTVREVWIKGERIVG